MQAKILEIFRSIQGEGKYVGVPQVFVRFFECNMHCVWCDTPNSIGDGKREYQEFDGKNLFGTIRRLWQNAHSVSLTGGEPLLQKDCIQELLPLLKKAKMPVYLETNGIFYQELQDIIEDVDIIAMDFKLPSSTKCRAYWDEHEKFLAVARRKDIFIKAVISSTTAAEDIIRAVAIVAKIDPDILFILQPNYFEMKNGVVQRCQELHEYCLRHLNQVRILPQIHKFMQLR